MDTEGIRESLERVYDAAPGEIDRAVEAFLGQLEAESLIAPGMPAVAPPATSVSAPSKIPFELPQLEKYEDLQDIILLDPVHMVDDAGWPHPAPVGSDQRSSAP